MRRPRIFTNALWGLALFFALLSLGVLSWQNRLPGHEAAAPQLLSSWRQHWDKPLSVFEEHDLPGEPAPPSPSRASKPESAAPAQLSAAKPEMAQPGPLAAAGSESAPALELGSTQPEPPLPSQAAGETPAAPQETPAPETSPQPPSPGEATLAEPETSKPKAEPAPEKKPLRGFGKLAVVIDDLGQEISSAQHLADLGAPLTFSILPYLPASRAVDALAARNGEHVILHQPMEPLAYPRLSPGRGAILSGMSSEDIAATLTANLAQLPHALGANNHMGSKLTQRRAEMAAALGVLKAKGLFFLDSLTAAASQGESEAAKLGLRFYSRDVFIDNRLSVQAILQRLRQAELAALQNGQAVAIGHPHPETLAALEIWLSRKDPRVKLVFLDELAPN